MAKGQFSRSTLDDERPSKKFKTEPCSVTPASGIPSKNPLSSSLDDDFATPQPTTEDDDVTVVDIENTPPKQANIKTEKAAIEVRPFKRVMKPSKKDNITSLLTKITENQELLRNRLSPYDKAIAIFKERFCAGLDAPKRMKFIALLADNSSCVNQFLAYDDIERRIFIDKRI